MPTHIIPVKILIICSNLGFGGAERVAVTLANGFLSRGHHVIVATNLYEKVNFSLDDGIILENIVSTNKNRFKKWFSSVKDFRKLVKHHQPDVVIGIMELCSLIAKIGTIGTNIPLVATDHYTFDRPQNAPFTKQQWFFKFIVNYIYKHITVLTDADKKVIGKKFRGVTVMPNPLSLQPAKELPLKENIVIAAGRIGGWYAKGFDVLLQAWTKIQGPTTKIQNWWLQIAGDGKKEDFEYLMSILEDSGFKFQVSSDGQKIWRSEKYHIEFLGFQKDIESLYRKSAIFALSSRYEGFGLVLIEAMSQGCAPVACDYKGRQKEILCPEGVSSSKYIRQDSSASSQDSSIEICENGIMCEPDHVEELASALEKMIKDEVYRKEVQKNAIERSKFYDMEHTMDRWEAYLKKVINAD